MQVIQNPENKKNGNQKESPPFFFLRGRLEDREIDPHTPKHAKT